MPSRMSIANRRRFLRSSMALGAVAFSTPGLFAEELARTARMTEGPFYPDKLPLDTDNDLLIINDGITPAVGEIAHVSGRLLSPAGEPIANALVEIWQCDNNGAYLHSGTSNRDKRDENFQGYGRFLTDRKGQYYFRTIKPVPYPGRTPHVHYMVKHPGGEDFTTQCYIKGHPQNERDFVLRGVGDQKARDLLCVDFVPIKESKVGELAANFDIVLGYTPSQA